MTPEERRKVIGLLIQDHEVLAGILPERGAGSWAGAQALRETLSLLDRARQVLMECGDLLFGMEQRARMAECIMLAHNYGAFAAKIAALLADLGPAPKEGE